MIVENILTKFSAAHAWVLSDLFCSCYLSCDLTASVTISLANCLAVTLMANGETGHEET